jgi:uncharacterized protein YjbI with pentapeptide repeats
VDRSEVTITLPLSGHGLGVILTALGIGAATAVVFLILKEQERNTERAPLALLTAFGWLVVPIWVALFAGTLWQVWLILSGGDSALVGAGRLGAGALLAALLGAPFVIWGTVLKHQTLRYQKEGHITDRITAAVEQLGAEKTVRMIVADKTQETTEPNIEVRIGAILSLERIAQDSTIHDKGRDHVRVMEILCAYVRENSNARAPVDFPLPEWEPLAEDADEAAQAEHVRKRHERFGDGFLEDPKARDWARSLPAPRADISLAVQVLGRRTAEQRRVEAAWPDPPGARTVWPFDAPCPELREGTEDAPLTVAEIAAFEEKLWTWRKTLLRYSGYRLDLRGANLQAADLSAKRPDATDAVFSGARLDGARMEGAGLLGARMEGVNLCKARMEGANLGGVRMAGANLWQTRMEGANVVHARMEGTNLLEARMEGARLYYARMKGADLYKARMEGGNLGWARMEGADLRQVQMEGANVMCARMEGTDLRRARMKGVKHPDRALLRGAALSDLNCSGVRFSQAQVDETFGDASVILPEGIIRPAHWPNWELPSMGEHAFDTEWRKWRDDPDGYTPPPEPEG